MADGELNLDAPETGEDAGAGGAAPSFDLWEDPEVVDLPSEDDAKGEQQGKPDESADKDKGKSEADEDEGGGDPPAWFVAMVEEEGEEAAGRYAAFLAGSPQGAETDTGGEKGKERPAVEEHDEWGWQQQAVASESEYQQLAARSSAMVQEFEKIGRDVAGITSRIAKLTDAGETGEDSALPELTAARDQLKAQQTRLAGEWQPIDKKLGDLEQTIMVNRAVERDSKLIPEIAANKAAYAKLVGEGKITPGISRQQVVELINAERTRAGKPPVGGKKGADAWAKVQKKLGFPKGVGGNNGKSAASGGKSGSGKGDADYSGFSPSVASMLRRADARFNHLNKKGGK